MEGRLSAAISKEAAIIRTPPERLPLEHALDLCDALDAQRSGMLGVALDWWQRPGEETPAACIERPRSVV